MLKAGLPPLPLQDERNFYSPSITSNSKQKVKHLRVIFAKLFLHVKVGIESIINANWPLISIILRILWRSYAEMVSLKSTLWKEISVILPQTTISVLSLVQWKITKTDERFSSSHSVSVIHKGHCKQSGWQSLTLPRTDYVFTEIWLSIFPLCSSFYLQKNTEIWLNGPAFSFASRRSFFMLEELQ